MTAFLYLILVFNLVSGVLSTVAIIYYCRAVRRIRVLDRLLASICMQAFTLQHVPIWKAWATVMGSYEVEVSSVRREWSDG